MGAFYLRTVLIKPYPALFSQTPRIPQALELWRWPEPVAISFKQALVHIQVQVVARLVDQPKNPHRVSQAIQADFIHILHLTDPLLHQTAGLQIKGMEDPVQRKLHHIFHPHRLLADGA